MFFLYILANSLSQVMLQKNHNNYILKIDLKIGYSV